MSHWILEGTWGHVYLESPTDAQSLILSQLSSAVLHLAQSVRGPVSDSVALALMATGQALLPGAMAYCQGAVSLVVGTAAPVEIPRPDWVVQVNLRRFQERPWLWAHPQRKL